MAGFDDSQDQNEQDFIDSSQDAADLSSTLTNSEYMVFLKEGHSQIRSSDSTPDLYRSTATQTSIKTKNCSTQYEDTGIDDPVKVTAYTLANKYFASDELKKKKYLMLYKCRLVNNTSRRY